MGLSSDISGPGVAAASVRSVHLNHLDWGQVAAGVIAAVAAIAAWVAALASRRSAHDLAVGQLISIHVQRLDALAKLHGTVSWISEGGGPRKSLTWAERHAVMLWQPTGTLVVRGWELQGMIEATGLDLPWSRQVADDMTSMKVKGVPINKALAEIRAAMKAANQALAALQAQVDKKTPAEAAAPANRREISS